MANRTRIIEGTWNCTSCDARNILARHRSCPHCNNPREETGRESEFDFGEVDAATGKSLREGVADEKALSAANAGADWFCDYCSASNRGDTPSCRNCRAERSSTSRFLAEEPEEPIEAPLSRRPPPAPAAPGSGRKWLYVGLGLLVFFGSCMLWGSRTHGVTGEVKTTAWTRTVYRETFQRVSREGWRSELSTRAPRMPVNGTGEVAGVENIRSCFPRQRGTRQVADGTERVCTTKTRQEKCGTREKCTRKKMSNGYMKEVCRDEPKYCSKSYQDCDMRTRYRSEPVFDVSCTYDTYVWQQVDTQVESGRDSAPRWPALDTGAYDRLRREEKYAVHIGYADGDAREHVHEPKSEAEFLTWKKGQSVPLEVNNFGSAHIVAGDAVH